MPLFYFDIDDGHHAVQDETGLECADLESACLQALQVLPSILIGMRPRADQRNMVVVVRDEHGRAVYRATLSMKGETLTDGACSRAL